MQKYTDAVWKWQEKDSKITKNKKAVFREGGLDLPLGEGSHSHPLVSQVGRLLLKALPSRAPEHCTNIPFFYFK